ncbi:MAG: hypothetical protein GF350_06090, partial [Chitinivibrionales bacterium]|nr:hypothetical protein [Chitinivibrionales bacterium]
MFRSGNTDTTAISGNNNRPNDRWKGYTAGKWHKKDKNKVTVLYNFVERRKSWFMRAFFERNGYRYKDLGDHTLEDVRWGKEYGNRMECNPMYFTSGSLLRNLFTVQKEKNLTKEEIVERYVFLGGGGQCGPCRYGMYPQEYWKALNDAGFTGFRVMIFSSGFSSEKPPPGSALRLGLKFRVNMAMAFVLSDFMHIAECALRPYAQNKKNALLALTRMERILLEAFRSRWWWFAVPAAMKRVGKVLRSIPRAKKDLPLVYVTGEFFANLAHNEGNYNLRRFIMDEGCEVFPGLFTNRVMYDFWRQERVFVRDLKYEKSIGVKVRSLRDICIARGRAAFVTYLYNRLKKALAPETFGGKAELYDLNHLAKLAHDYYHPEIFGGEGNLEVAEAVYYSDLVDGFISSKPFGCLTSSGISDGVQAKVMARFPQLNFLSIETSGDNEVGILSRVSMLLFKAKQRHWMRVKGKRRDDTA